MQAIKIKPDIYWVGAKDWNLRDFHGYKTNRGSSYNAYLIRDEKIVLIDTVKTTHYSEMLARIQSVIDPRRIDIVVSNHVEMDHSGSIEAILKLAPQAKVLASAQGVKGLPQYFHTADWNLEAVPTGEAIPIGKRHLKFIAMPLVHWPDSMATYIPEEKILMPNDAFGQHIAGEHIFDDQTGLDILLEEAAKYYANIILPYGSQVEKAMQALTGLEVEIIAPSHGVIWRSHIAAIWKKYLSWVAAKQVNKAVVVYDSMWGSTEIMAQAIKSGFEDHQVPVVIRSLKHSHISDIVTDLLEAKFVALGSPTLNNMILPSMGGFLTYIRGLKPKQKTAMIFGSYGWFPNALQTIKEAAVELGWQETQPLIQAKYRPTPAILEQIKTAVANMV